MDQHVASIFRKGTSFSRGLISSAKVPHLEIIHISSLECWIVLRMGANSSDNKYLNAIMIQKKGFLMMKSLVDIGCFKLSSFLVDYPLFYLTSFCFCKPCFLLPVINICSWPSLCNKHSNTFHLCDHHPCPCPFNMCFIIYFHIDCSFTLTIIFHSNSHDNQVGVKCKSEKCILNSFLYSF